MYPISVKQILWVFTPKLFTLSAKFTGRISWSMFIVNYQKSRYQINDFPLRCIVLKLNIDMFYRCWYPLQEENTSTSKPIFLPSASLYRSVDLHHHGVPGRVNSPLLVGQVTDRVTSQVWIAFNVLELVIHFFLFLIVNLRIV